MSEVKVQGGVDETATNGQLDPTGDSSSDSNRDTTSVSYGFWNTFLNATLILIVGFIFGRILGILLTSF